MGPASVQRIPTTVQRTRRTTRRRRQSNQRPALGTGGERAQRRGYGRALRIVLRQGYGRARRRIVLRRCGRARRRVPGGTAAPGWHAPTGMRLEGAGYSDEDAAGRPVPARTRPGAMVRPVAAPGGSATVRPSATPRASAPPASPRAMAPRHLQWYGSAYNGTARRGYYGRRASCNGTARRGADNDNIARPTIRPGAAARMSRSRSAEGARAGTSSAAAGQEARG